ncbi:hypothetical protein VC83_04396 [Pseudogymnoascus destructans]|uniref:Uncharacterized protein n=1 Tax=Pseudogymnoascus destructans TaxID=655981 RepID=A0A177AB64_9PEZI|nr:uncharacterized protein VC83_04396 [Pseudogymnoascus destructans]OAF59386.1 hypothetical protein VC83_04396 [Pseudogymnoascus destructans]
MSFIALPATPQSPLFLETWDDRQIQPISRVSRLWRPGIARSNQSSESPASGDRGAWEQLGSLENWDRQIRPISRVSRLWGPEIARSSQSPESPCSGDRGAWEALDSLERRSLEVWGAFERNGPKTRGREPHTYIGCSRVFH